MIRQGEIYFYPDPQIPLHPVVVVSREELNRGDRVGVTIIPSSRFAVRSNFPNCVPIKAGSFGLTKDCVVQGESIFNAPIACLELAAGPVGRLDSATVRDVVRAVGHVMGATCEPI